jgi:hypothetical protein
MTKFTGLSSHAQTRATQMWQFVGTRVLFHLSQASKDKKICRICQNHTEYPREWEYICIDKKPNKVYCLEEYPVDNILKDGYSFNRKGLKDSHKRVFI